MNFRTAGAFAALLFGTMGSGDLALAQYYPPPPPTPQAYPAPLPPLPSRSAPRIDDDDGSFYDPPTMQERPLLPPPGGRGAQGADPVPPANIGYGRAYPIDPDTGVELVPLPPDYVRRDRPPNLDPRLAALPPEEQPETGPRKELPPQFRRILVDYKTKEPPGTLIVDTQITYLYLVLEKGKAMRYGIGVGRDGFTWAGAERVSRMAEWPDWHPPEEMIERQPYLPRFMAGGPGNPLGARALYLGSTVYRIHGTNQPSTIGTFVSSGCIRLTNEDVTDLYSRVKVGTRVVVLPGKAPPGPSIMQVGSAPPPASARANAPRPPGELRPPATINGAPSPAR
jgi:lipoprotein-anchoring transpeptidase ErfK/SrfK